MTRKFFERKKKTKYSKGQLNLMIDDVLHPLFGRSNVFMVVDIVLHGIVEQNPPETIRKFVCYNLPKIVEVILESI